MRLNEDQIQAFLEDGVLVAEGVVTDADLEPVIREYEAWIDRRARELHDRGLIRDLAEGEDFGHRFARLYAQPVSKRAGQMETMNTALGIQAASRGMSSIFSTYRGSDF